MKKRFMFTLTKERVEEFQALCKEVGLPPATVSNAIDDFLRDMLATLKRARSQGSFTLKDVFHLMGEQVELIQREGLLDAEKRKKKDQERG